MLSEDAKLALSEFSLTDCLLPREFKEAYTKLLAEKKPSGYVNIEWAKYGARITSTTGKRVYLPNSWFYIAEKLVSLTEALNSQRKLFFDVFADSGLDMEAVAISLKKGSSDADEYKSLIKSKLDALGYSAEDVESFDEFVSNYQAWGGGKTIDRVDFFLLANESWRTPR